MVRSGGVGGGFDGELGGGELAGGLLGGAGEFGGGLLGRVGFCVGAELCAG